MIHTEGLTKQFGSLTAVDRLTLDVEEGEVFGFLGPNGAGKTTAVRMLASLISRTSGSAEIAGCSLGTPAEELRLRSRIGLLPENVGLYEAQSAYENLAYHGRLQGMEATALARSLERLLRMLGLWEKRDVPVATFSKGMKQKVAIARALVHDPQLLFLDEPTANLDPEASKTVREFILELKKEGRTIFLNTHHLDEAERICDRVGILRTRLLTVGSPTELKSRLWGSRTLARLEHVSEAVVAALRARLGECSIQLRGDSLIIGVSDPDRENPEIAEAILAAGGKLRELSPVSASLEDVYLTLVHEGGPAA
jgi:ABC-2 type transport system ATP-binding protein